MTVIALFLMICVVLGVLKQRLGRLSYVLMSLAAILSVAYAYHHPQ